MDKQDFVRGEEMIVSLKILTRYHHFLAGQILMQHPLFVHIQV